MSLPSADAAPVSGARRPILMGPPCADAVRGAASDAASATLRTAASVRTWMRVIGGAPLLPPGGGRAPRAPPGPPPETPPTPPGAKKKERPGDRPPAQNPPLA